MNGKKKLALLLSLLLVLMMVPATAQAQEATVENLVPPLYLALGDSISFGLTDIDPITTHFMGGYAARFYLDTLIGNGYAFENLSYPGNTTEDLLALVQSDEGKEYVSQADIITISIGSNNLLSPFIAAIAGMYDIELDPEDINGEDMLMELAQAIHDDYQTPLDGTPEDKLAMLYTPLNYVWQLGAKQFSDDWPEIMSAIRNVNPEAKIVIDNLYNPLLASKLSDPSFTALYDLVEKYIASINSSIYRSSQKYNYRVVHVYQSFNDPARYDYLLNPMPNPLTAPVAFNLPLALATAGNPSYNNTMFSLFFAFCDPHPTAVGHQLITKELIKAAKMK